MDEWLAGIAAKAALMSDSRLLVLRQLSREAKAGPLGSVQAAETKAAFAVYDAEAAKRGF